MFTGGFTKVSSIAGFFGKTLSKIKPPAPKLPTPKPITTATTLAKRLDGSKVTTDWGLKQGLKSGSIRYADIN